MEERLDVASRWLTALSALMIPLTGMVLASFAWYLNYMSYQYNTNKWTSYLLFACWLFLVLAVIAGISNLINPPQEGKGRKPPAHIPTLEEEGGAEEAEEEPPIGPRSKPRINFGYALLLIQSASFVLGILLFFIYISWLILGLKPLPQTSSGLGL